MDGFLWLILSWIIVGSICYFLLKKLSSKTSENIFTAAETETVKRYKSNSRAQTSEWTNEILAWLYRNFRRVPEPLEAWIKSLNEASRKIPSPENYDIFFEGFGDNSQVFTAPKISNISVEQGPKDHLTIRGIIDIREVNLKLVCSQKRESRLIPNKFDVKIIDLHGEIESRMAYIANQIYIMGCFQGRPELDIQLVNVNPANTGSSMKLGLIEEAIRKCLVTAVTNISITKVLSTVTTTTTPCGTPTREVIGRQTPIGEGATRQTPVKEITSQQGPTVPPRKSQSPLFTEKRTFPFPQRDPVIIDRSTANESEIALDDHSPLSNVLSVTQPKLSQEMKPSAQELMIGGYKPHKESALTVKVVRARKLGGDRNVIQPYVVIEMDEPPQKYITSKGIDSSPFWEEIFTFILLPESEEILFEVYEADPSAIKDESKFLGLALVGFDELRKSGKKVQEIELQSRPYRNDKVSGTLVLEFDFHDITLNSTIEREVIGTGKLHAEQELPEQSKIPIYDPHDSLGNHDNLPRPSVRRHGEVVLEKKEIPVITKVLEDDMAKSTHSKEMNTKVNSEISVKRESTNNEGIVVHEVRDNMNKHPQGARIQPKSKISKDSAVEDEPVQIIQTEVQKTHGPRDREKKVQNGLTKKRDRSFFAELRDRIGGRFQRRAKSMDLTSEAVSLPPSRDTSRTRQKERQKTRSETRSDGMRSAESTRSVYQYSTLVLEITKNNKTSYYLIPRSVIEEPSVTRLLKKGRKLHIYNEHTFIATKVSGGTICHICHRRIPRSFSKQAYQCRDCHMICHKYCHYRTMENCAESKVSTLNIAKDIDWKYFLRNFELEEFISMEGL